jgi:hypothetical protein
MKQLLAWTGSADSTITNKAVMAIGAHSRDPLAHPGHDHWSS